MTELEILCFGNTIISESKREKKTQKRAEEKYTVTHNKPKQCKPP